MSDKRPVDRHELETFYLALSEEQSIEWIACGGIFLQRDDNMRRLDREQCYAGRLSDLREFEQLNPQNQLAQPGFDRNLPKRSDAEIELRIVTFEHGRNRPPEAQRLLFEQADEDMRVQQKLQRQAG